MSPPGYLSRFGQELKRLPSYAGGAASLVNQTLIAGFLGVYLPWRLSFQFLDPLVIIPYALTGLIFASGASVEAFAGDDSSEEGEESAIRCRVGVVAVGGLGYSSLLTFTGLLVVNARNWHGDLIIPPAPVCVVAPLLSLAASGFMAASAALLLSRYYSPGDVKTRFRAALAGLVAVWVFRGWIVPVALKEWIAPLLTTRGIAVLTAIFSMLLALLAERRVRAARTKGNPAGVC